MEVMDFVKDAKSHVVIIGTNPLIPSLEQSAAKLADLLTKRPGLTLTILYESDTENFNQAVCMDTDLGPQRTTYSFLTVHRDRISGPEPGRGLAGEILDHIPDSDIKLKAESRVIARQMNLRAPVNIILADDKLWYCVSAHQLPTADSYLVLSSKSPLRSYLESYVEFCLSPDGGWNYLSQPQEDLIWVYDKQGIPRAICPRSCFYTTEFLRYSVWGFVFNRKGQLLLHRRSQRTSDNRGLWDKSIGGHVDLGDASTSFSAKRELIEEMFMPSAEHTEHLRADVGRIIDFGEWNPKKRPERFFREAFKALGENDWILFRATEEGVPLTITRVSNRRVHSDTGELQIKRTVFRSDVYLLIAPPDSLDTEEQIGSLVSKDKRGAASEHKLVTIDELRSMIHEEELTGRPLEQFTDDLLYINTEHRPLLEGFSEFLRYI